MHEHRKPSAWRAAIYPGVVGLALLLWWLGPWKAVAGIDAAAIIALVGGWRIFYVSIENLLRMRIAPDLAVALAAIGAIAIGENLAAAEVILIMLIGEALEDFAVGRTHQALERLASVVPRVARLREGGVEREAPVEQVTGGAIAVIRPGERIPVDGQVVEGSSDIDESALTGEGMPVSRRPGGKVLAGTVNISGALVVRADGPGTDSALHRVVRLMEQIEEQKAPAERRADRYAVYFVPIVLAISVVVYLVTRSATSAIAVMVVACPCSLVLAVPTAIVAGIGRLATEGVLVKRGEALEQVGHATCVVLDKTGTLTGARPEVAAAIAFGVTKEQLLQVAASAEALSEHVIARSIRQEAQDRGITLRAAGEFTSAPGLGVRATIDGRAVAVGRLEMLQQEGTPISEQAARAAGELRASGNSLVYISLDGELVGLIGIRDRVREGAREAVEALKACGVEHIMLLTGDNETAALQVALQVGIESVCAGVLPDEKVARIRELQGEGFRVVMVGDGVNDAPALSAADVGVAMGDVGTDIAAEAADIVLMTDDLSRLARIVAVSRRAVRTIDQNIRWFAFGFNGLGVIAAGTGLITPVVAAVCHQIGSLLVVGNSLRLLGSPHTLIGRLKRAAAGRWPGHATQALLRLIPARSDVSRWLGTHRRSLCRWGAAALVAAYLASGLCVVRVGETALVRVFGRLTGTRLGPGLHYCPPWPVGTTTVVQTARIRAIEIGFRTSGAKGMPEPAAYEWNTQHRSTGYRKVFDEATMLSGDANLLHVTVVVQYRVTDPAQFVIRTANAPGLMKCLCEHATRCAINATSMSRVLTGARGRIEQVIQREAQQIADRYGCGVRVVRVGLQDVHPPLEVVGAFREVAGEQERKLLRINEAEAYALEQELLGDGEADKAARDAAAYRYSRTRRAKGEAQRFAARQKAYRSGAEVERARLHLQTVEEALGGADKLIMDRRHVGRRQLLFLGPDGLKLSVPDDWAPTDRQANDAETSESSEQYPD